MVKDSDDVTAELVPTFRLGVRIAAALRANSFVSGGRVFEWERRMYAGDAERIETVLRDFGITPTVIRTALETRAATEPPAAPERMRISYEPVGRCLWHEDCDRRPTGIMRVVQEEQGRSLLECLQCKKRGYYPVGSVGPVCVDVVSSAQPQGAQLTAMESMLGEQPIHTCIDNKWQFGKLATCPRCSGTTKESDLDSCPHASDCAVHNAPALPVGPCTCGAIGPSTAHGEGGEHG